jgi:hypothetical protein
VCSEKSFHTFVNDASASEKQCKDTEKTWNCKAEFAKMPYSGRIFALVKLPDAGR